MAETEFTIIPAQPGFNLIEASDGELLTDWPATVIAWRIETELVRGDWTSMSYAITPEGSNSNYVAMQMPDGRVEMMGSSYQNLDEAATEYKALTATKSSVR